MKNPCFYLLCFLFLQNNLNLTAQTDDPRYPADKETFPFGIVEKIDSKILDEQRTLNIYLPAAYHSSPDSTRTFPVVYVLDGSYNEDFPHLAGLMQFMNMYDIAPQSIVVGIANTDRKRDFTHAVKNKSYLKNTPTGGGSEAFINFLGKELQPFVEKNYKTNGEATLIGQSLGGLLASEVWLKKPQLFDNYIIVSPSLWWDDERLVKSATVKQMQAIKEDKKVFLAVGDEHWIMRQTADQLSHPLRAAENKKIKFTYELFPNEDHATILHRAVYRAFEVFGKE